MRLSYIRYDEDEEYYVFYGLESTLYISFTESCQPGLLLREDKLNAEEIEDELGPGLAVHLHPESTLLVRLISSLGEETTALTFEGECVNMEYRAIIPPL